MIDLGCDAIVAQGLEAGGHRGMFLDMDLNTQVGTFALVPQIVGASRGRSTIHCPPTCDPDLIMFLFFYHDTTYMPVDRPEMNRKAHAALKPGGILVIADPSAKSRDGSSVGKSLHRIEESAASGSRGGGIQAGCRRRFLAPPRGCARLLDPATERQSGRRVRAQISEADVTGRRRVHWLSSLARKAVAVDAHEGAIGRAGGCYGLLQETYHAES